VPTSCYTGSRAEPTPWYVGDAVAVQSGLDPADARRGGGVTRSIDDRLAGRSQDAKQRENDDIERSCPQQTLL
jgi:hypothetical protein